MTDAFLKFTDINNNPDVYRNTFELGTTTGPDRLVIAPAARHIELILNLLGNMPGPFGFLYILSVAQGRAPEGRYQLANSLTLKEITNLLTDYRRFFESDGRHTLFIASHSDGAMLVYDRHNVIYAYGDLDQYMIHLEKLGYRKEDVRFPIPHVHHYHSELNAEETRLINGNEWLTFPLQDEDLE